MTEKTRSISVGDADIITASTYNNDLHFSTVSDNISTMNTSQISTISIDCGIASQAKTNLNITHNIGGVSRKLTVFFSFFLSLGRNPPSYKLIQLSLLTNKQVVIIHKAPRTEHKN